MCRRAHLDLEPTPQAAGEARRFVADTCHRWGIESVVDELTLAVSELVTNAVLHGSEPIQVAVPKKKKSFLGFLQDTVKLKFKSPSRNKSTE